MNGPLSMAKRSSWSQVSWPDRARSIARSPWEAIRKKSLRHGPHDLSRRRTEPFVVCIATIWWWWWWIFGSFINVLSMEITWGRSVANAWFVTIHAWLQRACTLQFWRSKKQVLGFLLSGIATMGWLKLMARCSCRSWIYIYIYVVVEFSFCMFLFIHFWWLNR